MYSTYDATIEPLSPAAAPSPTQSSIAEGQALVRRCAEPRPAGDRVKAAILRASRWLKFPFYRTRALWYGESRRIDANEMDRLREEAAKAELAQAADCIEVLRSRALASDSASSRQVAAALTTALRALGRDRSRRVMSGPPLLRTAEASGSPDHAAPAVPLHRSRSSELDYQLRCARSRRSTLSSLFIS